MKSRHNSPQPELVRMRTFKLENAPEAPRLQLNEVFSPSMNLNGINGFFSSESSPTPPPPPNRNIGNSPAPSTASSQPVRPPLYHRTTPTKASASHGSRHGSPMPSEDNFEWRGTASTSETPASESSNDPWSSAIGRATTGKSGRVIERLMGDNDRMQRDIKLATVKLEEEVKRGESARVALDSLRATNENLKAIHEADKAALLRRDRKIEELKADLEAERIRRDQAEVVMRDVTRERDETVGRCRREALEEKEVARKAVSQYEILSRSWSSLDDGYRRQVEKLQADINNSQTERVEDREKLAQLEVVIGQLHQESEKTRRAKERVMLQFEEYKREKEDGLREIRERAERSDKANEAALVEMQTVLGEMRWAMNVKRDVRGAQ
ncbi:hypothetical protein MMC25_005455 [Agyrium rufum]|nr:hypothetical protein [Agyrium rufum]